MSVILFNNDKYHDWRHVAWDMPEEEKKHTERFMEDKDKQTFRHCLEHNQIRNLRCNSETEDFLGKFSMRGLGPQSIELALKDNAVIGFYIVIDDEKGLLQYENGKLQWLHDSVFYNIDLHAMKYVTDATKSDIETFIRLNFNYWVLEESEWCDVEQFVPIIERNIPVIVRIWMENSRNFAKKLGPTLKIDREKNFSKVKGFIALLDKLLE